jgi:CMP-2-keto-3-deoxyoctulosonic acid synthetase
MVVRVAEQARRSGAAEVIVATDHDEIANAVKRTASTS